MLRINMNTTAIDINWHKWVELAVQILGATLSSLMQSSEMLSIFDKIRNLKIIILLNNDIYWGLIAFLENSNHVKFKSM